MTITTEMPKYVSVKGGPKRMLNPEFVALWESYLDEGLSAKAVGEIFGVPKESVLKYYPGRGWNAQQKLEHSIAIRTLNRI
jgi:hypothetical protein